ncbi:pyocin knob domain-containing protein [Hungatella hominis]|uniref:pyocin knob domain-containing protein n=1 Tax=Hungatella hominis TaxID=2763050 RepID=UPI001FAD7C22|nr:pyocin knob domain-containing protein [Hungatella hominis]
MVLTSFLEKLNKVDGNIYVIEESVDLKDGVYSGTLEHDNINPMTLTVHTGPKLTGDRIETYALSTPSLTPWKREIRIYADVPRVYISYECDGDTVEAEDINNVQAAINMTQKALNEEESRAEDAEKELGRIIQSETDRAIMAEQQIDEKVNEEKRRAEGAEKVLTDNLALESARATKAEKKLTEDLSAEITRATGVEATLTENLSAETERAREAERKLTADLTAEVTRSKAAEKTNADNLTAEVARAKAAEKVNTDAITTETNRAKIKETELQGNIQAEAGRATAAEDSIRNIISTNKPNWDDKYTKNEVDNKFSALETAIDWKEAVNTFADLSTTYPHPDDGWTVNVKDTDYTYRWSGTAWIAISANAIPKATQSVDGLLSKEDKAALDDTNAKKHTHSNKSTLDKLTETLLANWTDAYNKRHEHGNKSVIDKITQTLLDNWTAAYTHIGDAVKHITATERANWNDANSKKHTHENKSIIDNLTQAMLDKLSGIATGAEVNVQADWNVVDENSDAYIKNKPSAMPASDVLAWAKAANKPAYSWSEITSKPSTFAPSAHNHVKSQITDFPSSMPASDVAAWAKAAAKPSYGWTEITGKPSTFAPSTHNHTKSQITDIPTKLSQFTNDSGYITQADVDTSQSHTHSNKTILDKITQAMLDKWNSALTALPVHTHTKSQITDFPASLPANGGTANYANYLNVNNIAADTDLNTITTPGYYYCPMSSTVATFKNSPTTMSFFMEVGKHAGTYQRLVEYVTSTPRTFERNLYSGTWGTWKNITVLTPVPVGAKFTDTVFQHPDSGVTAGTYQNVTVNAQGHVTGGTPQGPFTWNQVHGAYTWDQLKGV